MNTARGTRIHDASAWRSSCTDFGAGLPASLQVQHLGGALDVRRPQGIVDGTAMIFGMRSSAGAGLVGAFLLVVGACGAAQQESAATGSVAKTSPSADVGSNRLTARPLGSVEGAPLGYLEYLPSGYGEGESRPLLVFLHGAGETGDGSAETLDLVLKLGIPFLIEAGEWPGEHPFVVLMPQYRPEHADEDCSFAEDLSAFLAFATEHYDVDPNRVYLTGISCGAIGIWDYLAHPDEVVAAAVPIAGHAKRAFDAAGCALGRVPVWAFHGALDEVVAVANIEGPVEQIRACDDPEPAEMQLTVYPDADHFDRDAWTRTYDLSAGHDIYAWMLAHRR